MSLEGSPKDPTNKPSIVLPMVVNPSNPSNPPSSQNAPDRASLIPFPSPVALYAASCSEATVNSVCGALAGVASGIVTCPLDVIKTKLQAQAGFRPRMPGDPLAPSLVRYRGMMGTAKIIWTQDGLRGLYRGLGPMVFGYLPTWAVYMGVYGRSREYYYTVMEDNHWLAQMCASVTAGACSTLATNPIWVIKTRLMSQVGAAASKDSRTPWHYKNTLDAFRQMYRSEGMRAFYSGLAPALLGLSHVAIQFPLYEYFKFQFTGLEMGDSSSKDHHTFGILAATFLSKVCATCATYPHEVLRTRLQTQQRRPGESPRSKIGPLRSYGVDRPVSGPGSLKDAMKPHYHGVIQTFKTILTEEGWRAFYFGMGTNLFRAVPSAMTTMLTFESLKRLVHQLQADGRRQRDE